METYLDEKQKDRDPLIKSLIYVKVERGALRVALLNDLKKVNQSRPKMYTDSFMPRLMPFKNML